MRKITVFRASSDVTGTWSVFGHHWATGWFKVAGPFSSEKEANIWILNNPRGIVV